MKRIHADILQGLRPRPLSRWERLRLAVQEGAAAVRDPAESIQQSQPPLRL